MSHSGLICAAFCVFSLDKFQQHFNETRQVIAPEQTTFDFFNKKKKTVGSYLSSFNKREWNSTYNHKSNTALIIFFQIFFMMQRVKSFHVESRSSQLQLRRKRERDNYDSGLN